MQDTLDKEVREIDYVSLLLGLGVGLIIAVISSLITFRKGIEHRKRIAEAEIGSAEQEGQRIVSEAEKIAERKRGRHFTRPGRKSIEAGWN